MGHLFLYPCGASAVNGGLASEVHDILSIAKLLLNKSANMNAQDRHYYHALYSTSTQRRSGITNVLFDQGADMKFKGWAL